MTQIIDITLNEWMTRGGDARIVLDPGTGLNRYYSSPFSNDVLAFASSTANDLGPEAEAFLAQRYPEGADILESGAAYGACLDGLREEIRRAYGLTAGVDIFFAPSGTDLEYVGLLTAAGHKSGGIVNHLLGADEVGAGCVHSAAGHHFGNETALGHRVSPGQTIAGFPTVVMGDSPVRCQKGEAYESEYLTSALERSIAAALAKDCSALVHIVHGSKTGLVLPHIKDVDRLRARFGKDLRFVVDACQARITADAIRAYLDRGIVVFVTGSKFMGGPPFSGFALLPPGLASCAAPLPEGMALIFRRAEIPASWPGRDICEDSGNPGLALRLGASLFELSRFQKLGLVRATRVVEAFTEATDRLSATLGIRKVASAPAGDASDPARHPIEMLTLVTLDLCYGADGILKRRLTIDDAGRIHKSLIDKGIRLGQPVRCVRLPDGQWGATLRIGLSMPQITRLDALDDRDLRNSLAENMDCIASRLAPHLAR